MKLIWIVFLQSVTVFERNTVITIDKNYEIGLKDTADSHSLEESWYSEKQLEKLICIKKVWEDKFKAISSYLFNENNTQINWIVGDNGSWKTTILNLIKDATNGRPIKRNYSNQSIQLLIQKGSWIIYLFETTENGIKNNGHVNLLVSTIDLDFNTAPDDLIIEKRAVLKTILSKVLKKEHYQFAVRIQSHNTTKTGTKYDTIEFLYLFIKIYLGEEVMSPRVRKKQKELALIFNKLLKLDAESIKEYCFLKIAFHFSWFRNIHSWNFFEDYEEELDYIFRKIPGILSENMWDEDPYDLERLKKYFDEILENPDQADDVFNEIREKLYTFFNFKEYLDLLGNMYFDGNSDGGKEYFYYKTIAIRESEIDEYLKEVRGSKLLSYNVIFWEKGAEYWFEGLSSWERTTISLFLKVNEALNSQQWLNILLIDEPENSLHLRLQTNFLNMFLENISLFLKKWNSLQLIISTHSPFIISDLPKENVTFLTKWPRFSTDAYKDLSIKETFLANIAEIVADWFFLDWNNGIITWEVWKKFLHKVRNDMKESDNRIAYNSELKSRYDLIQDKFLKEMLFFLNLGPND